MLYRCECEYSSFERFREVYLCIRFISSNSKHFSSHRGCGYHIREIMVTCDCHI